MRKTLLLSALSLLLVSSSSYAQETDAAAVHSLRVEAALPGKEFRHEQFFTADVKLINEGTAPVKLKTMTCTKMDNWMTDSPAVVIAETNCEKNEPAEVTLEPGKSLEDKIGLLVLERPSRTTHSFRVGFRSGEATETLHAWSIPLEVEIQGA